MARNSGTPKNKAKVPAKAKAKAKAPAKAKAKAKVKAPEIIPAKPVKKVSKSSTASRPVTYVANQTMGNIIFPRKSTYGAAIKPLVIPAGHSVPVDTEEWLERKKNPVVQSYIDYGLLAEATSEGEVPVKAATTSELPIPEHLQNEEELAAGGNDTGAKGLGVTKEVAGTVTIK